MSAQLGWKKGSQKAEGAVGGGYTFHGMEVLKVRKGVTINNEWTGGKQRGIFMEEAERFGSVTEKTENPHKRRE